jgi:fibronectin-binding autotransporter adhesin
MIKRTIVLAIAVGLYVSSAMGDVTPSGEVDPSDPSAWTSSTHVKIGLTRRGGSGGVIVDNDSDVSTASCAIGYDGDTTGSVTVSGSGSTWSNSGYLYVGRLGDGVLNITNSGSVSSGSGRIAGWHDKTGTATVSGSWSIWANTGDLDIGYYGSGRLDILDGGMVTVGGVTAMAERGGVDAEINFSNGTLRTGGFVGGVNMLSGTGVISTTGFLSDEDLVFNAANGMTQTFTLTGSGRNITVNLNQGGLSPAGAGYTGTGSLHISDGRQVQSSYGCLGYKTGSSGIATVNGAGSAWTMPGNLYIGKEGHGELSITNGARVSSRGGEIGDWRDSSGSVIVSGGSTWTNSGRLEVGGIGSGTLEITGGSSVSNTDATIAGWPNTTCSATVSGPGTTWTTAGNLQIGRGGNGTLNIADQAVVSVQGDTVAISQGGPTGVINLDNGTFNTGGLVVGESYLTGTGTINTNSLVGDRHMVYDSIDDLTRTITLVGPGRNITINLDVDGTGSMGAGVGGSGSMRISNGLSITSPHGYVGYYGSLGVVKVSGPGTTWTNSLDMTIGLEGVGHLEISDGATVSSRMRTFVANRDNSFGSVTIKGDGSRWTNLGKVELGSRGGSRPAGIGMISISDGGLVSIAGDHGECMRIEDNGSGLSFITIATDGKLAFAGDLDGSLADFLSRIRGPGDIRYWKSSIGDWTNITGATRDEDYTLEYMTTGEMSGYTVLTVTTAPEPATLTFLALGGLAVLRRRNRKIATC